MKASTRHRQDQRTIAGRRETRALAIRWFTSAAEGGVLVHSAIACPRHLALLMAREPSVCGSGDYTDPVNCTVCQEVE